MNRLFYIIAISTFFVCMLAPCSAYARVTPISEMNLEFTPCAVELAPGHRILPISSSAVKGMIVINDFDETGNNETTSLMRLDNSKFVNSISYLYISLASNDIPADEVVLGLSESEALIQRHVEYSLGMKGNEYYVLNAITRDMAAITPDNLEVSPEFSISPSADSFYVLYKPDVGLIFFIYGEQGTIEVWQGKKVLAKTQEIPNIAFIGRAFGKEGWTTVLATKSGVAYVYSYLLQKAVPSLGFSRLAERAVKHGAEQNCNAVFTSDYVIWNNAIWKPLEFADKEGRYSTLKTLDPPVDADYRPIPTGKELRPTDISSYMYIFALDERRAVIEDVLYNRCVIITPKK